MGERLIVSSGGELREYGLPQRTLLRSIVLEGAGALCTAGGTVYAASSAQNVIWRLDGKLLVPTGLFAGGPGMRCLMVSKDGTRLYALCSDADSLLMLGAGSGEPMVVNRVGVNPSAMAMDECGKTIAVAGGASGEVLLLCASTLTIQNRLQTPGVVFGAAFLSDVVYALSLDETMNSVLSVFMRDGRRLCQKLEGMPGTLASVNGGVAAATHGTLWQMMYGDDRARRMGRLPGRAVKILQTDQGLMVIDMWSDTLYMQHGADGSRWHALAFGVQDALLL